MSNQEHEKVYNQSNREDAFRTVNKGDIHDESKPLEEKKEQLAVDSWDIDGKVEVPAYFPVEDENGEEEALHHVKDAEKISDVIRQARVDEDGERKWW